MRCEHCQDLMVEALYDVGRFYRYRPFLLERHLARLFREAEELALPARFSSEEIAGAVRGLVARSEAPDGIVYIQWTRGVGPRSLIVPEGLRPNVFAMRFPLPKPPPRFRREALLTARLHDRGESAIARVP